LLKTEDPEGHKCLCALKYANLDAAA